jgi:hypothetical protein
MSANVQYHRVIRKLVVGFGNLFNNITLVRYNPDNSESERMVVPIAYASKELYVMRLQDDPDLSKKVMITLPRMSFEMTGLTYDASRKQNTNLKQFAKTTGGVTSQYNPVPYDFDFSLYLYVRNIEDGTQLIEHILPYFTPDYTIKLNLVPEMGIIKEVPIVLKNTNYEVQYEGNFESDTRMVIWTLNFTVKGFVFGKTTTAGLIKTSITNIYNDITQEDVIAFNMANSGQGGYQTGEMVYQGYSPATATATGKVVFWANTIHKLTLTEVNGNFVSGSPIVGMKTNANYSFTSYEMGPQKLAKIVITPNPANANANSKYTYTTTITEAPNIT